MLSDVFVPLMTYPDSTSAEFAQHLQDFISKFASEVTYAAAEIDLPNLADRWGGSLVALPGMIAEIEASSRESAKLLVQRTGSDIAGLRATRETFRALLGQAASAFVAKARFHDLSLVASTPGSSEKISLAEELIFGTGRPTMVVPEINLSDFDIRNVAIAWDGGLHAGRAVFDAMPLLKNARSVTIMTVGPDSLKDSVQPIRSYLERHDVASNSIQLKDHEPNTGKLLQEQALAIGAGCMVMGGYGHSRFQEFVLGGVTRTVLNTPILPVFIAH